MNRNKCVLWLTGTTALLSACQPTLNPDLPTGPAAYEALAVSALPEEPNTYSLNPGDVVAVTVFQEPDLSASRLLIDDGGNISLPLIGQVHAAGLSTERLAERITQQYAQGYLRDPSATVALVEVSRKYVTVEGEVTDPGVYQVQRGYTLLDAVALAGSPSPTAKLDQILVFREVQGQRMGARFDLTAIRSGQMPNPRLLPGDTIVVGFSAVRGTYRDILQASPLLGIFSRF